MAAERKDVHVNVDQPRRDIQTVDIQRLDGRTVDSWRDTCDPIAADRYIHDAVTTIGGVDNVSAPQHQVVLH